MQHPPQLAAHMHQQRVFHVCCTEKNLQKFGISAHQHLLHLAACAACCSARHTRVSDTSNGACRNSAPTLLSTSTGYLPGPWLVVAWLTTPPGCCLLPALPALPTAAAAALAQLLPGCGTRRKAAATCALWDCCSRKLFMCGGGRLLQRSSGATSSTLVRNAATSCCWVGGPVAVLQSLQDSRQSPCSTTQHRWALLASNLELMNAAGCQ